MESLPQLARRIGRGRSQSAKQGVGVRLQFESLEDRRMLAVAPELVKDINLLGGSSNPHRIVEVGSVTFFAADDGVSGYELWKSDGTEAGTVRVKDIRSGSGYSNPRSLTNVGGTLYFRAFDETTGQELWTSDGSDAGTVRVKDIRSGIFGSDPRYLTNVGGTLYFRANDGTSGEELWKVRPDNASFGDLNGDTSIDGADLGLVFANWGNAGTGDLTADGIVDGADVAVIYSNWTGDQTPTRSSAAPVSAPVVVTTSVKSHPVPRTDRSIRAGAHDTTFAQAQPGDWIPDILPTRARPRSTHRPRART